MTRRPGSAVHVPPDCLSEVSREAAEHLAEVLTNRAGVLRSTFGGSPPPGLAYSAERHLAVAAMLRRLAPYLPQEAAQEAVQAGQGGDATPHA